MPHPIVITLAVVLVFGLAAWQGFVVRRLRSVLRHVSDQLSIVLRQHQVPFIDLYGKHSKRDLWMTELADIVRAKADALVTPETPTGD